MDLNGLKLADKVWLVVKPVLSDDQKADIAGQLHSIFTDHQVDLHETDLASFVKTTGISVGVTVDL